ncbi:MAG TPA: Type 1 glutamine amidotransferase-like domain-containing protein [Candidatus Dormibacteraeota bacterium]|nr:Type 1 glutamine amidotransferase-like domain-containing protein [Candidatus Dormibacteraeota bacterium]
MSGHFLLMGAGEFLPWSNEAELYTLSAAREGPVAVLATASAPEGERVFERWGEMALTHYQSLGVPARLIELKTRQDASRVDLIAGIKEASMIFFSGGNPVYLGRTLDGTPFLDSIARAVADGAVFAGCSAGAMVAGARAVRPVGPAFRHVGLSLIPHVRFGVHWNRMPGLLPGLREFIVSGGGPADRFVGIDENTAIWATAPGGVFLGSVGSRCAVQTGGPGFVLETTSACLDPTRP